jgi:FlaA1/EpsC-like NDP-sugar epimerase
VEARDAYLDLLNEIDFERFRVAGESHIAAIAEYRLADLRVEKAPMEACDRWRRVVDIHDEEVSPYAALRMALQIGSSHLVNERVERLFHYAMGTSDARLHAEASLGLARHLKERNQFGEARRYFQAVIEADSASDLCGEASEELEAMGRYEEMVRAREPLRCPQQLLEKARAGVRAPFGPTRRVVMVGAGTGGSYLLESLEPRRYTVCGVIDDSAAEVPGHPEHQIVGRIENLEEVLGDIKPDEVLLAIPTLAGARRRLVARACQHARVPLHALPAMHELGIGWTRKKSRTSLMKQLRPVKLGETLGEERRALDTVATGWLQYRSALVVGAGAIGSELCRRLADAEVKRLIVVDKRESALKKIENELRDLREFWALDTRLGNAEDAHFLARLFESCTPYIVFNATGDAAALAFDAARLARDQDGWKSLFDNEVAVAWELARVAGEQGVPRVVHVSSRRAGVPDDPLGALKSLCEDLVLWQSSHHPATTYSVVRVGPLLDSRNGRFTAVEEKIKSGGVVIVPPAGAWATFLPAARWAELTLHAARLAEGGDLFEPAGGVRFSPRKVAEDAVELAGHYLEDVVIEETDKERWDEPCSRVRYQQVGEPELQMRALERMPMSALAELIGECATVIDQHVAGGSGEAAAWVLATLAARSPAELVP